MAGAHPNINIKVAIYIMTHLHYYTFAAVAYFSIDLISVIIWIVIKDNWI